MTAHNAAGNRIVTSQVSTLTLLGQTIAPSLLSTAAPAVTGGSGVEGSLAISAILTIIILATALLLSLYCYKRYSGYTKEEGEWQVVFRSLVVVVFRILEQSMGVRNWVV